MNIEERIQMAVRRTVGIAALRRLRRLVDDETAQERENSLWASRLAVVFTAAALLLLFWLALRAS